MHMYAQIMILAYLHETKKLQAIKTGSVYVRTLLCTCTSQWIMHVLTFIMLNNAFLMNPVVKFEIKEEFVK